jgi:curved DNA-binding protein CbpA
VLTPLSPKHGGDRLSGRDPRLSHQVPRNSMPALAGRGKPTAKPESDLRSPQRPIKRVLGGHVQASCEACRPRTQFGVRGFSMGNWYEVLGTTSRADDEQIKTAFRNLAKTLHPDVNAGDRDSEERFKEVNQAYEVLRDPEARATYDTYLANKRSRTRQRLRKVVATMSAAFVLSGASSYLFISWLQRETFPPAQAHVSAPQSENVQAMPTPGVISGADHQAGRQGGDAELAIASSTEPHGAAQIAATQGLRGDAQTTNTRKALARWIAYQRKRTPHVANPVHALVDAADGRREAVGSPSPRTPTQAEVEQAVRMLDKGRQFLAQGNIVIAREYFARAAELGSPVAALKLAETHDPQEPGDFVYGLRRDPSEARKWYERAMELGVSEAEGKLRRLNGH